jgi:phosphatidylserine/phosphatidylglycerophosphate/cardiolipin synthase-like enzyme
VGAVEGRVVPPGVDRAAEMSWLLQFTSTDPSSAEGDGRPWGDGTAMAARARSGDDPWDNGCTVTPMIGGFVTLDAIRHAFEEAIADAEGQTAKPGQRGHVYIADWLFNGLRDLSVDNPWGGNPWTSSSQAKHDQTALGLVVRMMSAGIAVRMLLWEPTTYQTAGGWFAAGMEPLAAEHWNVAAAIQDHNAALQQELAPTEQLGIVGLDIRTADQPTAALHQKMIAIRVGKVNVAFCGGVDLAFTRRDFGLVPGKAVGSGDWQSGDTIPLSKDGWPKQSPPPAGGYPPFPYKAQARYPEDLPPLIYGDGYRHWHDQHLRLEGPIVATLEQQFAERWVMDVGDRVFPFKRDAREIGSYDQVQFTSTAAYTPDKTIVPLPPAAPVAPTGEAVVQMWRTIPLRPNVAKGPFKRGELTVMAGIANAVAQAESLITIWDQYFWSVPLARLLAAQLMAKPELRLLIVLPPYGTTTPGCELALRMKALQTLWNGLDAPGRARVVALDMWNPVQNVGVYVHAKVQTYDTMVMACGSANMNRRSHECDAELDCAVMHPPTVRAHLASLYSMFTGRSWQEFGPGWAEGYLNALQAYAKGRLVPDPFFAGSAPKDPKTPNGQPMPYGCSTPRCLFEPTSIGSDVEKAVCAGSPGDPGAPGRLDEISYLLERCHKGDDWPYRYPSNWFEPEIYGAEVAAMPRLTL